MTLDYPEIPSKVIDWGPGKHMLSVGDVNAPYDMDVAVALEKSSRWTDLPDREDEGQQRQDGTIAVLSLHATEKGSASVASSYIELTGGDCLNLATHLLAAIEAAGGATMWFIREGDPTLEERLMDDPADMQRKGY